MASSHLSRSFSGGGARVSRGAGPKPSLSRQHRGQKLVKWGAMHIIDTYYISGCIVMEETSHLQAKAAGAASPRGCEPPAFTGEFLREVLGGARSQRSRKREDCMASTTLPATGKRGRIAEAAPFDPWAFDLASGNGPAGDREPPEPT